MAVSSGPIRINDISECQPTCFRTSSLTKNSHQTCVPQQKIKNYAHLAHKFHHLITSRPRIALLCPCSNKVRKMALNENLYCCSWKSFAKSVDSSPRFCILSRINMISYHESQSTATMYWRVTARSRTLSHLADQENFPITLIYFVMV